MRKLLIALIAIMATPALANLNETTHDLTDITPVPISYGACVHYDGGEIYHGPRILVTGPGEGVGYCLITFN
jgi:hypothetical protein